MAILNYANINSGKLAYAIGWLDFGNIPLTPPTSITHHVYTLPNNSIFSFDIQSSGGGLAVSTKPVPTWSGAAMGRLGYTGIQGNIAIFGTGNGMVTIPITNIKMIDDFGNLITNYAMYLADAEATRSDGGEGVGMESDGGPLYQVDVYPSNLPCPSYSGEGTSVVKIGFNNPCTGPGWNSRIFQTTSPNSIYASLLSIGGNEALALGLSYQRLKLIKDVSNRLYPEDQFELIITGPINNSTITTGTLSGTQPNFAYVYGGIGDIFTINEQMAPGSRGTYAGYIQEITTIVNTSGGSIPTGLILGGTLPLNVGDFIEVTIRNTPIIPIITPIKSVDLATAFQGDTLTYTIILPNTYPNPGINSVLIDTLPIGTTFINGSITINDIPTNNSLPNITIGTIPANSSVTVTFKVTIDGTIPKVSPIYNNSTLVYKYPSVNSIPNLVTNSNTVETIIYQRPSISSKKYVDKTIATFNEAINYTVVFSNTGYVPLTPLTFIDSIPSGSTFVNNSVNINNINFPSLNPNNPGFIVTNPTILNPFEAITITFRVTVDTIYTSKTILNNATLLYGYTDTLPHEGSEFTNTVSTKVAYIDLLTKKYVDKPYATIGDVITYTLTVTNLGNITAVNSFLKDTIPNNLQYVLGSLTVNGLPTAGTPDFINLPSILGAETITITFKMEVI